MGRRFSGRWGHQLVAHEGSLWLVGGIVGGGQYLGDVWRSGNGEDWKLVTASAAFSARNAHQAVSYGGSLWVAGGYGTEDVTGDVWRSADGEDWELVTATAAFAVRSSHQMVAHSVRFAYEVADISMIEPMTVVTIFFRYDCAGDGGDAAGEGRGGAVSV